MRLGKGQRTFGVIGGRNGGPVVRFLVMLGLPCDSPQRTGCTARRACQTSNVALIRACGQPWLLFVNTTKLAERQLRPGARRAQSRGGRERTCG